MLRSAHPESVKPAVNSRRRLRAPPAKVESRYPASRSARREPTDTFATKARTPGTASRRRALDFPALTWIIRILQFVSALDRVWDEVRVRSLQVLQLAYDVHAHRLRQFASLSINPWAPQDETWMHSVTTPTSPSSPSDLPYPAPWKSRPDPPGGSYSIFSGRPPPPKPYYRAPNFCPRPAPGSPDWARTPGAASSSGAPA